jgi:hypothetical protein
MKESDLQKLNTAVEYLLRQESFSTTVERLKGELAGSDICLVDSRVGLDPLRTAC